MDDILALVERGQEIYGVDPPIDRSERTIKDGNNKRQLECDGATHTIHFCNNLHVNAEMYNPGRTICLYCGGARHYTSDHFGYQFKGEAPKRGEVRFDMYTAGYRRFDNIIQSRKKHSFNHFVKPIDEPARKAYNKVVNQIDDATNYPSLTKLPTKGRSLYHASYPSDNLNPSRRPPDNKSSTKSMMKTKTNIYPSVPLSSASHALLLEEKAHNVFKAIERTRSAATKLSINQQYRTLLFSFPTLYILF